MAMKQISQDTVYDNGFFSLVNSKVQETTTNRTFERIHVKHVGAVGIIPVLDNGDIVLVKQYRATIDADSIEVVAGRRDVDDEPLEVCAKRELIEEAGYDATDIVSLGWIHTSPGYSDEVLHLFMGKGCTKLESNKPDGIEEEFMETVITSIDTALTWVLDGTITDSKSIIAIYRMALLNGYSIAKS